MVLAGGERLNDDALYDVLDVDVLHDALYDARDRVLDDVVCDVLDGTLRDELDGMLDDALNDALDNALDVVGSGSYESSIGCTALGRELQGDVLVVFLLNRQICRLMATFTL